MRKIDSNSKIYARAALGTAVITLCAWITIPSALPFTLQTFAVALLSVLLGARTSLAAVSVYLLLGLSGLPVFSGFRGGIGVILGATGGYIVGFLPFCLISGTLSSRLPKSFPYIILSMVSGLISCYALGTIWYACIYPGGSVIGAAFLPFILPDGIKLCLAALLVGKLQSLL